MSKKTLDARYSTIFTPKLILIRVISTFPPYTGLKTMSQTDSVLINSEISLNLFKH